jgi:hypothetical protein
MVAAIRIGEVELEQNGNRMRGTVPTTHTHTPSMIRMVGLLVDDRSHRMCVDRSVD